MSKVVDWTLKIFEQTKKENCVQMNTALSGKKRQDGTYGKSMPIRVVVTDDTDWAHADLSGKLVDVTGNFTIDDYTNKKGENVMSYTIFADSIKEHVFEEKNAPKKNEQEKKW